ncbi:hypothetical protein I6N96_06495 [Enterococcus sp. BWM-S5]|uniref:DUF997 family protein n=1 Tax=Enterococcus larvae TaxID=2794352 RepID=A0ABS4CIT5_9ENTE|nr:hypothetical protein [Enterococcus larvae]MBP1045925.1 hypothetical protein [Enterococcus larvae]
MDERSFWVSIVGFLILVMLTFSLLDYGYGIYWGGALAGTYEYGLPLLFFGWIPLLIGIGLIPVDIVLLVMIIRMGMKMRK